MTDGLPDLQLLESTHVFPCPYPFKVFGTPDHHFVGRVLAAVKSALEESAEPAFSSRSTPSGRHLCVTIEPIVQNGLQIHEIYRELQKLDGLVLLM